jgi:hypothetical protein
MDNKPQAAPQLPFGEEPDDDTDLRVAAFRRWISAVKRSDMTAARREIRRLMAWGYNVELLSQREERKR